MAFSRENDGAVGFCRPWISLIMICIETVKYRIKVNGELTEEITPSRGLRQDESLLLLKVDEENVSHLQHILQLYEECSGQIINKEKSAVMFSKNASEEAKQQFLVGMGVSQEKKNDRYLGLPVYMGKSKSKVFAYFKDRVWKRIQGWKERLLSRAGKDVLIKSVAQAIPSIAMSCFDIMKSLCDEMSAMMCRYWWAQQENENKMHWVA